MEFPENPKPSEEEMIAAYVKTLAAVVGRYVMKIIHLLLLLLLGLLVILISGVFFFFFFCISEEEAKKKIYSVCTTTYTGFGALISEELSYKVKGMGFLGHIYLFAVFLDFHLVGCFPLIWKW